MIITGSLLWFNVWATVARGFLWAFGLLLISKSTAKKNTPNTRSNNINPNKVKSNKKK